VTPVGPGGWQGRGPNLFPAVGRNFSSEQLAGSEGKAPPVCRYVWGGEARDIGVHGFIKDVTTWELDNLHSTEEYGQLDVILDSTTLSEEVKAAYPFPFKQRVIYKLQDGVLSVTFTIVAGEGAVAPGVPFSIGNHITLKFPYTPDGSWEAGVLKGTATQQFGLTSCSLLDGTTTPRPEFSGDGLSLTVPASCNMVSGAFPGDDCYLELTQPGFLTVRVSQPPVADPALNSHRYFVMWGDADGRFFCPEPWLGAPNSLNTHTGVVVLSAGQSFDWTYSVQATKL